MVTNCPYTYRNIYAYQCEGLCFCIADSKQGCEVVRRQGKDPPVYSEANWPFPNPRLGTLTQRSTIGLNMLTQCLR